MSPEERAWVGAMIEGEGHIHIGRRQRGSLFGFVIVTICDIETISTLLRLVGDGTVHMPRRRAPNHLQPWTWILSPMRSMADLLPQVIPYLTSKRVRAEELLVGLRAA